MEKIWLDFILCVLVGVIWGLVLDLFGLLFKWLLYDSNYIVFSDNYIEFYGVWEFIC